MDEFVRIGNYEFSLRHVTYIGYLHCPEEIYVEFTTGTRITFGRPEDIAAFVEWRDAEQCNAIDEIFASMPAGAVASEPQ